ncbi:hypothetical protein D3C73_1330000 [compost metagenome]
MIGRSAQITQAGFLCVDLKTCGGTLVEALRILRILVPAALEQQHLPAIDRQLQGQGYARRPRTDDADVVEVAQFFLRLIVFDHVCAG